jgi:hypothetical protein
MGPLRWLIALRKPGTSKHVGSQSRVSLKPGMVFLPATRERVVELVYQASGCREASMQLSQKSGKKSVG